MTGTHAEAAANAHGVTHTDRDAATGHVTLTATGRSLTGLLTNVMTALLDLLRATPITATKSGKILRVRGEGNEPGSLLVALCASLLDELDAMNLTPVEITIDGLVRSDSGLIAWASVLVVERSRTGTSFSIEVPGNLSESAGVFAFALQLHRNE